LLKSHHSDTKETSKN